MKVLLLGIEFLISAILIIAIFYSGDFRAHGRKEALFTELVQNSPKNIDYLMMEGTNIGRTKKNKY